MLCKGCLNCQLWGETSALIITMSLMFDSVLTLST